MKARLRGAALLACTALVFAGAGVARASEVTSAQLSALAARAADGDQSALAELRSVDTVDGRPAQIAAALNARNDQQLTARLEALAAGGSSVTAADGLTAAEAQQTASEILSSRRFGNEPVPNPVGSVFDKVGRWLEKLAAGAPGGPAVFWGLIAAIVLALTALGVRRQMRRLDPLRRTRPMRDAPVADTPASLERDALAAEARGDFGEAVRLRFRAGLLTLNANKTIEYRPSLLRSDVSRRLRSPQFDSLADTFERIAYGGEPGGEADAAAAKEGWKEVIGAQPHR